MSPMLDERPLPSGERSMPELKTRLHWLMGLRVAIVTVMLGSPWPFSQRVANRHRLSPRSSSSPTPLPSMYALVLRRLTTAVAYTAFIWVQVGCGW